jgi:hypothetical protein
MNPGTIFFHRSFVFHDGATAQKLAVVLGGNAGTIIVAKTTSNGTHRHIVHGCHVFGRHPSFLLARGCCFLSKDTWVCFNEFYEFQLGQLQQLVVAGIVNRIGLLDPNMTRDVQACAAGTDDISAAQEAMVRSSFVPAPP